MGPFGPALTNPFVAIPPSQLSTYIPLVSQLHSGPNGIEYVHPNGIVGGNFLGTVKPLKVADLACPPFGLGVGTSTDGQKYTIIGPPYLPIIVPPPQVLHLDPQWESLCSGFLSYALGLQSFAIFDPPRSLVPVGQIAPDPPAPDPPVTPSKAAASKTPPLEPATTSVIVPAQSPAANTPKPTSDPSPASPPTDAPLVVDPSTQDDPPTEGAPPTQGDPLIQGDPTTGKSTCTGKRTITGTVAAAESVSKQRESTWKSAY